MEKKTVKKRILQALLLSLILLLCACGKKQIVITTGFGEDEVFRVEDLKCTEAEVMLYMYNLHSQYERAYGSGIWNAGGAGTDLSQNLKQTVLARLAKIKLMNIMAERYQVVLNGEQKAKATQAAKLYFASLSSEETALMKGITQDLVQSMYEEYAVAELLYDKLTESINSEISDDEARVVRLHQIALLKDKVTEDGESVHTDISELETKAESLLKRINDGEDFDTMAYALNDEEQISVDMVKGGADKETEELCFGLAEGECGYVKNDKGVYIYKCISTYDRQQTEERKKKLANERKKQYFDRTYEEFASGMEIYMNEELWDSIQTESITMAAQTDFFEIYDRFFGTK